MLYEDVLALNECELIPCNQREDEEHWLETRKSGIGGSDAGAIMGLNKFASPLSVYLSKKGIASTESNDYMAYGHRMEPVIRDWTREDLGVEIEEVPGMFKSRNIEFMNANLDGLIYLPEEKEIAGVPLIGLGGHEIKTSSGDGFTYDEIPDSYYCQVQHYMAVTGLEWFVLTVHINGSPRLIHYAILRNSDFIEKLISCETDFWENYYLKNVSPIPGGNQNETDMVKSLPMPETVSLPDEYECVFADYDEIKMQISNLEKSADAIKNAILMKISEYNTDAVSADRTTATCGPWKVTYNLQTKSSLDTDALKKAGIYSMYLKKISSKVMRITRSSK